MFGDYRRARPCLGITGVHSHVWGLQACTPMFAFYILHAISMISSRPGLSFPNHSFVLLGDAFFVLFCFRGKVLLYSLDLELLYRLYRLAFNSYDPSGIIQARSVIPSWG